MSNSIYVEAIIILGGSASPKQIRNFLLARESGNISPQNVASALYGLRTRGKIKRLENGLYSIPTETRNSADGNADNSVGSSAENYTETNTKNNTETESLI